MLLITELLQNHQGLSELLVKSLAIEIQKKKSQCHMIAQDFNKTLTLTLRSKIPTLLPAAAFNHCGCLSNQSYFGLSRLLK